MDPRKSFAEPKVNSDSLDRVKDPRSELQRAVLHDGVDENRMDTTTDTEITETDVGNTIRIDENISKGNDGIQGNITGAGSSKLISDPEAQKPIEVINIQSQPERSGNREREHNELQKTGESSDELIYFNRVSTICNKIFENPLTSSCPHYVGDKKWKSYFAHFEKQIPTEWKYYFGSFNAREYDGLKESIGVMLHTISLYAKKMINQLLPLQPACVAEKEFDKIHTRCFAEASQILVNDHNWKVKSFKKIAETEIELIRSKLLTRNAEISKHLDDTVRASLRHAETIYNNSMTASQVPKVLTESQVKKYHEMYKQATLEAFQLNPRGTQMRPMIWNEARDELNRNLEKRLAHFLKENNRRLDNEIKANTGKGTAEERKSTTDREIEDEQVGSNSSSSNHQNYGLGIYIGQDIVRIGVYKNSKEGLVHSNEFAPFITFDSNEIIYFKEHKNFNRNQFHIYTLLENSPHVRKPVPCSGRNVQLATEEIIAIFLNKIKTDVEEKVKVGFKSCVVAVSAYLSTVAKHILQTSLSLAGFERSKLIQSTTAIGLSYIMKTKESGNHAVAFVHQNSSRFDVAIATVEQHRLNIKSIRGHRLGERSTRDTFLNFPKFWQDGDTKKKMNTSTIAYEEAGNISSPIKYLGIATGEGCKDHSNDICHALGRPEYFKWNEVDSIVFGAAAFDAYQNGNPGIPFLDYTEISPFALTVKLNETCFIKLNPNEPIIPKTWQINHRAPNTCDKLTIISQTVDNKESVIAKYDIGRNQLGLRFVVSLSSEGIIQVEIKSANRVKEEIPVSIVGAFMTTDEKRGAAENLRSLEILTITGSNDDNDNDNDSLTMTMTMPNVKPAAVTETSSSSSSSSATETTSVMRTKLVEMIQDVKSKLETNTVKNSFVLEQIKNRIQLSEDTVGKTDATETQLKVAIERLKGVADKIK